MIKFAESAKSSLSQQTSAILVASLFRHQLLHNIAFYFPPKKNLREKGVGAL